MTQRLLKRGHFGRVLVASCLVSIAMTSARGSAPDSVLAYDFTQAKNGLVSAGRHSELDLRAPDIKDGALAGKEAARPVDAAKAARWLSEASPNEFSAGFWIRFDKLPSEGTPIGLFGVSADKDGFVTIRLFAAPGEFQGDYVMKSTTPVKKGDWHHIEFTYSLIQWRASLYLDGRFQWENDNLYLPHLAYGPLVLVDGFRGAIRDIRLYDMAIPSEWLAIEGDSQGKCTPLANRAKELSSKATNKYLRGWLDNLAKKASGFAAAPGKATIGEVKELALDIDNAGKIVKTLAESKDLGGRVANTPLTVYTVNPLSQELYLPRTLPKKGEISGQIKIAATRNEFESGSAIAVAFKPIEIRKVSVSDLRGPNGKIIPAKNIDIKLVKRWFRTGGAWLSYHCDRRQRNLTPDLLVNDDDVIRVDEWRRRNYLRLDYPEGRHYVDVSDPVKEHRYWRNDAPLRDAKTIQPVKIAEAGRNQQFLFTVHVPADAQEGKYTGAIYFDGTDAWMQLVVRVLPFDLPTEPSTYYDIDKTVISHVNRLPPTLGPTHKARVDYMRKLIALLRSHNMFHTTGLWDSEEHIKISKEEGLVPDKIFGVGAGYGHPALKHEYNWTTFYPGVPLDELTSADKKAALRIIYSTARPWQKFFKKNFPPDAEPYTLFYSESTAFPRLNTLQGDQADVAHNLGQKVFAHGWDANIHYAGAIQDMHSVIVLDDKKEASAWHSAGGELISYADTFPGTENPFWFRRRVGLRTYKDGYDGEMLHGLINVRTPWNEFAFDPGGDGNYRNFAMIFPQQDGYISTLAMDGVREAYDDLRYATRLRQLALANRDSKDNDLSRESRRQLLWLENIDGDTVDLDMFRLATIDNICLLQDMIKTRKGVLPPADKVKKQ